MRTLLILLVAAFAMACGDKAAPRSTLPSPGPTFCADLGKLIDAARLNFPDLRRQDRPVDVDHQPGFEPTVVLANTVACRILTSDRPGTDAYECDLAKVDSPAAAKAVIDKWAPVVGACPQLASWHADEPSELGRTWELETGDDHELAVHLTTSGDDKTRPTLTIQRNEI